MKILTKIDHFFFGTYNPLPAALCRILTGVTLTLSTVAKTPIWEFYYSYNGWPSLYSNSNPQFNKPFGLLYGCEHDLWIWVTYFGLLACALLFTIGFRTRSAAVVGLILLQSLAMRNPYSITQFDMVARSVLLFSCFGGFSKVLSVDSARHKKDPDSTTVWPIRMVQINLCLIYLFSVYGKLVENSTWLADNSVYWFIINPTNGISYLSLLPLSTNTHLTTLFTYAVPISQILFIPLIWVEKWKIIPFSIMFLFHYFLLVACPNMTLFSLSLIACLVLFTPKTILEVIQPFKDFAPGQKGC